MTACLIVAACAALAISSPLRAADNDDTQKSKPRQPGVGVPAKLPGPISGITPGSGTPLSRRRDGSTSSGGTGGSGGSGGSGGGTGGGTGGGRPPIIIIPGGWNHGHWGGSGSGVWLGTGNSTDGPDAVSTDHWRLHVHVNAPSLATAKRRYWWRYPYWGHTHWCWWNDTRYSIGWGWDYADPWLIVQAQKSAEELQRARVDEQRREAERFERLTDLQKANELMLQGPDQAARAAGFYVKHLDTAKNDADAMRLLAVALLRSGKVDQAAAMMAMAYDRRPILAHQPLDTAALSSSSREFRKYVTDSVNYAHKTKSASAWLTVSVLMHAEQRLEPARAMLAKAKAAGLASEVVSEMELALARR
jgi:hypothetical protein